MSYGVESDKEYFIASPTTTVTYVNEPSILSSKVSSNYAAVLLYVLEI